MRRKCEYVCVHIDLSYHWDHGGGAPSSSSSITQTTSRPSLFPGEMMLCMSMAVYKLYPTHTYTCSLITPLQQNQESTSYVDASKPCQSILHSA